MTERTAKLTAEFRNELTSIRAGYQSYEALINNLYTLVEKLSTQLQGVEREAIKSNNHLAIQIEKLEAQSNKLMSVLPK